MPKPKSFKCVNCGCRSVNSGFYYKKSNEINGSKHCRECEKAHYHQMQEDFEWYEQNRM